MRRSLLAIVLGLLVVAGCSRGPGSGSIAVTVAGLQDGVSADVTLSGPNGYTRALTKTTSMTRLEPGTYTVSATDVTVDDATFTATVDGSPLALTPGSRLEATVTYTEKAQPPKTGALQVSVSGLPADASGNVTVTGPDGFARTLTKTATLSDLEPGAYTVTAADVTAGQTYTASVTGSPATVSAGATAEVAVAYSTTAPPVLGGNLEVTVSGLPSGADATVLVEGPDGFSQTLTATTTLSSLQPGEYTVTGKSVSAGADTYVATVNTSPLGVVTSQTVSAEVVYSKQAPTTGSLEVTISGLPTSTDAAVTVTGPDGFSQTLKVSQTLSDLTPGDYTVTAGNVTSSYTYAATVASSPVNVTAGAVAQATIAYSATTGVLQVDISGLPSGTDADVSVSGPSSFARSFKASDTLNDLATGDYALTAADVTVGSNTYTPTVTGSPAAVTAGVTASASVTYAPVPGSLQIDVTGLPSGVDADVTVSAGGYGQTLKASETLSVAPGEYTVTAKDVMTKYNYTATITASPATVTANATTTVTVAYTATTGDLEVTISGLPDSTDAAVTVTGPGNFSRTLTGSETFTGLTLGQYTVKGDSVTVGDDTYQATVSGSPASVTGANVASVRVSYSPYRLWVPLQGTPGLVAYRSGQLVSSGSPAPDIAVSRSDIASANHAVVAFDSEGNAWVGGYGSSKTISKFSAASLATSGTVAPSVTISADANGSLNNPYSLTFDKDGSLWVANISGSSLVKYTPNQLTGSGNPTPAVRIGSNQSSLSGPVGLAFDSTGNLWVANQHSSKLAKYTPAQLAASGNPLPDVTISGLANAISLAFDSSGTLWVSTFYRNTLVGFTPDQLTASGSPTPSVTISGNGNGSLSSPGGLAFDSEGSLWVGNTNATTVVKYTAAQLAATGSPTPDVTISGLPARPGYSHLAFYPTPPGLPINTP